MNTIEEHEKKLIVLEKVFRNTNQKDIIAIHRIFERMNMEEEAIKELKREKR